MKICIVSGRLWLGENQPVEKTVESCASSTSRQEKMAAEEQQTQTTSWESAEWSARVMNVCNQLSSEICKAKKTSLGTERESSITDGVFIPLWKGKM